MKMEKMKKKPKKTRVNTWYNYRIRGKKPKIKAASTFSFLLKGV